MADRMITYSILESWLNNQSLQPPVETIRDAVELLKEQEVEKKCCRDCEYYGACHDE